MERLGIYLYCFARAGLSQPIRAPGIGGRDTVTTLVAQNVAAIVSQVSLGEFEVHAAESGAQDPAWLIPRACQHERVVEEAMRASPVLPVSFGAVFSSSDVLTQLLTDKVAVITQFLADISDREEWAVKGFLDATEAGAWLSANDSALTEQRKRMPTSSGARYFHEKRLDAEVQRRVKGWARSLAERIQAELERGAADVCPLKLQPKARSGRDGEMVLNSAFLLRRQAVAPFQNQVKTLEADCAAQGLTLEASGPWPAYNFCPAIEVTEQ